MKVLVATRRTQGLRRNDYCFTVEGELVLPAALIECCDPGRCGCGRGFPGLASSRATTTAMIVERPELTVAGLRMAIHDSLGRQGYLEGLGHDEVEELIDEQVELLRKVTARWPVGSVLERNGPRVSQRQRVA